MLTSNTLADETEYMDESRKSNGEPTDSFRETAREISFTWKSLRLTGHASCEASARSRRVAAWMLSILQNTGIIH